MTPSDFKPSFAVDISKLYAPPTVVGSEPTLLLESQELYIPVAPFLQARERIDRERGYTILPNGEQGRIL